MIKWKGLIARTVKTIPLLWAIPKTREKTFFMWRTAPTAAPKGRGRSYRALKLAMVFAIFVVPGALVAYLAIRILIMPTKKEAKDEKDNEK